MKKFIISTALLLVLCLAFAGCSGGDMKNAAQSYDMLAPQAESQRAVDEYVTTDNTSITGENESLGADLSNRKIILNATLSIQTLDFDSFIAAFESQVGLAGGYISSSYIGGNSYYGSSAGTAIKNRYASLTARIPADRLHEFLGVVDGLGNVTGRNVTKSDVTTHYVDTEARLNSLKTERDALLSILAKAETVEDVVTVQSRLSEVNYQIESFEMTMRSLDEQISFSTVTVDLREVERETVVEEESFGEEVSRRFKESLEDVGEGFTDFAAWFVGNLPSIIVWVVIVGGFTVALVFIIKGGKKRSARREERKAKKIAARYAKLQAAQREKDAAQSEKDAAQSEKDAAQSEKDAENN